MSDPDDRLLPPEVTSLLDAVTALSSDLNLASILSRIVEAASQLTGAAYGALGVIGSDDTLTEFVTTGLPESTRLQIGDLPHGRGILGLLIREPRTIRLEDLSAHPASAGFPTHHPRMTTFLGVPVKVREVVFGNLYLTEKRGGESFTAADAHLVEALARTAGFVIDNARTYGLSERRRQWLEVSAELSTALQPPIELREAMLHIARAARSVVAARATAVLGVTERVVLADPTDMERVEAAMDGVAALPHHHPVLAEESGLHVLSIPMQAHLTDGGVLVAVFDTPADVEDRELLISLADQAALALDRAKAVTDRQQLAVMTDRERIARDLHDIVIQRLFATGLQLQAVSHMADNAALAARLEQSIDDLDTTIRDIRHTIFELNTPAGGSLRADLRDLAVEYAAVLGFAPVVRTSGPVDTAVREGVRSHVLAVAREALSNAARHAAASAVTLEVRVDADSVVVTAWDDGVGLPEDRIESGLHNVRQRAEQLGGSLELTPNVPRGTLLVWRVSLS